MIGFWNISVYLTYAGLISAVCGIFLSIRGSFLPAVICLLFSGLCDTFDGKIARSIKRTEQEKSFGIQIDSLCDLVCFGVCPAVLCYQLGMNTVVGIIVLCLFVLFGQVRLAYYNVTEEERQKTENGKRKYYQGLPITNSSLLVPILFALRPLLGNSFSTVLTVCIALLSLMFVLNVPIPKPGKIGVTLMLAIGVLTAAAAVIFAL